MNGVLVDKHEPSRERDFSDEYFVEDNLTQSTVIESVNPNIGESTTKYYSNVLSKVSNLVQKTALDTIGYNDLIHSPFSSTIDPINNNNSRLITYCDYTASGRSLLSIEEYLLNEVIPLYANTHTLSDATGLQTTLFRREAREIVKRGCRGSNVEDTLLFFGSGSTSAINSLIHILDIQHLSSTNRTPLVLLGPYEHHSNILPWREAGAEVLTCPESTTNNGVDLIILEEILKKYRNQNEDRLIIGSFSAASNVSGIIEDTIKVTEILKRFNSLSVWDYACAAPYLPIDMNPMNDNRFKKDVIFFSPHKYLGGVGTPGVMVIKKNLLKNTVPYRPGGGSVLYVTSNSTTYLSNFEEKEEAGTPDIIGSIRCGLVFQLRESIGIDRIYQSELEHSKHLRSELSKIKNLVLLGDNGSTNGNQQLPIISFLIRYENDPTLFLHHNYIASLLNDLFGIQSRASCACAGPYLECLLGLSERDNKEILESIFEKQEIIRPGMVRLNVSFTHTLQEVEFIINAIKFICLNGWKFMPLYTLVVSSGEWKHRSKLNKMPDRRWLSSINYNNSNGKLEYQSKRKQINLTDCLNDSNQIMDKLHIIKNSYFDEANQILSNLLLNPPKILPDQSSMLTNEANKLRWFPLPTDISNILQHYNINNNQDNNNNEIYLKLKESSTVISPLLGRECIIKPHKSLIPGTNYILNRKLPDNLILNNLNQQVYPIVKVLNSISTLNINSNSNSNGNNDNSETTEEICLIKPKLDKDNSGLVESKICINCFHDHTHIMVSSNSRSNSSNNESSKECRSCECVSFVPKMEGSKKERDNLQKKINTNVVQTILNYEMIKDGDRIMVGVSGGKDSLTLIHTLLDLRRRSKAKYTVAACTVDPQSPDYDPSQLKNYFKSLGVPYFYISQSIMESAKECMLKEGISNKASICAYCSRMRRGIMYDVCRKEGYNVLALGHHLDDLAESFLMSAFYNGILSTMKVNYLNEQGDVRIIRPLANIRENQTRLFAKVNGLPVITDSCPACFSAPLQRQKMKLLLAAQENVNPMIHHILYKTMQPLLKIEKTNRNSGRSLGIKSINSDDNSNNNQEDEKQE